MKWKRLENGDWQAQGNNGDFSCLENKKWLVRPLSFCGSQKTFLYSSGNNKNFRDKGIMSKKSLLGG